MFFMIGINDGRKDIAYAGRLMSCPGCGQTGSCSVFMTYTVLLLFFIPCFKWNRRYFVRTSCCNRTYELSFEKNIWFSEDITVGKGYNLIDRFTPASEFEEGWSGPLRGECFREIILLK